MFDKSFLSRIERLRQSLRMLGFRSAHISHIGFEAMSSTSLSSPQSFSTSSSHPWSNNMADHKAFFASEGYVIARGLFDTNEVESIQSHFTSIANGEPIPGFWEPKRDGSETTVGERYPRVIMPHRWDEFTRRWLLDARWRPILTTLLGDDVMAALSMFYFKPPGSPGQALHQDNFYLHVRPGTCLGAWMAVDPARPRYLDESALETPSLALTDAARETLRMGDMVESMLRDVMTAIMTNDRSLVDHVTQMDNNVDGLDEAIKLYVTKLTRGSLDEREGQRAMEIISFAINLEHIGDIIDKNLSELATKKIKRRFQFSPEGAAELSDFHRRTLESLRIAFGVFMSGDVGEARKLLTEKAILRSVELAATERHLDRLREGRPETIETTSLHLDVLRDLKRIHSHICSVAYPVLDAAGELEKVPTAGRAVVADAPPNAHPSPR